jgi:hypothetical protein
MKNFLKDIFYRAILSSIASMLIVILIIKNRYDRYDSDLMSTTSARLVQMDRMKNDLKDFQIFIATQQMVIEEYDTKLRDLISKHNLYENALSINRDQMESIMAMYEEQLNRQKKMDIPIGIVIGIVSSLIAQVIFVRFGKKNEIEKVQGAA